MYVFWEATCEQLITFAHNVAKTIKQASLSGAPSFRCTSGAQ